MQVRSWATILLSMSFEATSLLGVIASISSIKRMHGALAYEMGGGKKFSTNTKSVSETLSILWCFI